MISGSRILEVYNNPDFDCVQYTMDFGRTVGEIVMSVNNEEPISPLINIASQGIKVP